MYVPAVWRPDKIFQRHVTPIGVYFPYLHQKVSRPTPVVTLCLSIDLKENIPTLGFYHIVKLPAAGTMILLGRLVNMAERDTTPQKMKSPAVQDTTRRQDSVKILNDKCLVMCLTGQGDYFICRSRFVGLALAFFPESGAPQSCPTVRAKNPTNQHGRFHIEIAAIGIQS